MGRNALQQAVFAVLLLVGVEGLGDSVGEEEETLALVDPGLAPGTGTPEPGGMLSRELLRAIRQVVGAVELAGMDVVEVAPAYDVSEITAAAAHRCVMEAISALAAKRRDAGGTPRPSGRSRDG